MGKKVNKCLLWMKVAIIQCFGNIFSSMNIFDCKNVNASKQLPFPLFIRSMFRKVLLHTWKSKTVSDVFTSFKIRCFNLEYYCLKLIRRNVIITMSECHICTLVIYCPVSSISHWCNRLFELLLSAFFWKLKSCWLNMQSWWICSMPPSLFCNNLPKLVPCEQCSSCGEV